MPSICFLFVVVISLEFFLLRFFLSVPSVHTQMERENVVAVFFRRSRFLLLSFSFRRMYYALLFYGARIYRLGWPGHSPFTFAERGTGYYHCRRSRQSPHACMYVCVCEREHTVCFKIPTGNIESVDKQKRENKKTVRKIFKTKESESCVERKIERQTTTNVSMSKCIRRTDRGGDECFARSIWEAIFQSKLLSI